MKNYLEIVKHSSKHNKKQSRMTVLCIILTVFLVTSVFSMADFEYTHSKSKALKDHGNWHILLDLNRVTEQEAEAVAHNKNVKACCKYDTINYNLDKDFYIENRRVCVIGTEENLFSDIFTEMLQTGCFPRNASEIMLNCNSQIVYGYKIGDAVTIKTPEASFKFTISGFFNDTSTSLADDATIAILDYQSFDTLAEANNQIREPQYYIQFHESLKIKRIIAELKNTNGWTDLDYSENTALLGITGMSTSDYVVGLYGVAAGLGVLVILAGVLMISGSINANVAKRTQFFGMLRCIGAGKRQIRKIVRREALNWLIVAMPIGISASVIACWLVCAYMAYGIGGEWSGMPVWRVSIIGIILGALVGYITVLLSATAPAKKAAAVSPITAVTDVNSRSFGGNNRGKTRIPVDVSLGIFHATSSKKSMLLMTGSFALSIILFLFFAVMIDWVGNALTSNKPYTPDAAVYYPDYSSGLDYNFAEQLRSIEGVKYVYGRMHENAKVESSANIDRIDLISYDDLQFRWAVKDVNRGNIKEVKTSIGYVAVVYSKYNKLNIGDEIYIDDKCMTVAAILSDSPFSDDEIPTVICSEQSFNYVCGERDYSVIDIQFDKSAGDDTISKIRSLADENLIISDRREAKTETNSTYLAFCVLVYGFLALVALIAVFNILNSVSMSASARKKVYGMLRAIGMDDRQLKRVICSEALTYGLSGCLTGCAIGIPLNAWAYKISITNYWGIDWKLPVSELLIIILLILFSAVIAVQAPFRSLTDAPIVEIISK